MTTEPITVALFDFLRDLRDNNDREWFAANKGRYVADVRDPMLGFIADFAAPLAEISPHFVADPRANGGSLFRIYRDTRFSRDKTPYKTNVGAHFRHAAGKDAHAPGFYLHLEPGMCFAACGVWRPDGPTVTKIREAIDEGQDEWTRITRARAFTGIFEFEGESLKRPPRGYDPGHPLVEDLKRKDFAVVTSFFAGDLRLSLACTSPRRRRCGATCSSGSPGLPGRGRRSWSSCRTRWVWSSRGSSDGRLP